MGQTIAERYLLEDPLGEGPVGSVFRGKAKGPSGFTRAVTIKHLHHQLARSDDFVETLMSEGTALMAGPHPNVEGIVDVVRTGEDVYLVVDPIDGPSLRDWVESFHATSAPAPWISLLAIAAQVLRGLHVLHCRPRPLAHGGVEPTSIRLDRSGVPILTRFGVAAACDAGDVGATSLRVPAPEGSLRPSADVFAVGLAIYTVLAGTSDPALLPDELRARLPELGEDRLVATRFASDGEVADLVRQVLDEGLGRKDEIKRRIRHWRADHRRV